MRVEKLYVRDIAECIERIESYTRGGREAFMQTRMIQGAVVRNFEIIGEATKRLSQSLKEAYPDIQWQQIAGFRDVLIHDYIRVDLDEASRTASSIEAIASRSSFLSISASASMSLAFSRSLVRCLLMLVMRFKVVRIRSI